ncbi:MAG: hypothetical protein LIP23_10520 [Planctomycetes bacterium]|nr:hypothetical protein [Planctomycetota bacterium]
MDKLVFEKVEIDFLGHEYVGAKILINDMALLEKVTSIEIPYAVAEGHPDIAGAYSHQIAENLHSQLTGERVDDPDDPRVALLTCDCLEDGCWSLLAECAIDKNQVVWRRFSNNHRGWEYTALGEFHFDQKQYAEEILKLRGFFQDIP